MQEYTISIARALEIQQSYTKPSIWYSIILSDIAFLCDIMHYINSNPSHCLNFPYQIFSMGDYTNIRHCNRKFSITNMQYFTNWNREGTRYTHGLVSVNKPATELSRVFTRMPATNISESYFQAHSVPAKSIPYWYAISCIVINVLISHLYTIWINSSRPSGTYMKWDTIGSDKVFSPVWHQAITSTFDA